MKQRDALAARIRVLPELVVNQIAAGEVIERPASVVKELVENALDAGATHVTVELELGGAQLIRVRDDGSGMSAADLELAFAPHATSKLSEVGDLEHIATLGFRGEALASIGSVARCRMVSRPRGESAGAAIENQGGRLTPVRAAGHPEGTEIEVRDLFFNTPARRRFLKTPATELARCLDVLQRLALAHEEVALTVAHDGRRALEVEAGLDLRGRIRRLFGAELAQALVAVGASTGDTHLAGFVAPPRFARADTARQMWFVNGRSLRDKLLVRVLKDAYRGFLVDGRQPVAFLSLALDPARVDVNVHPAKAEVRFRDDRALFGFLVRALGDAVRSTDMATSGEQLLASAERRGAWSSSPMAPSALGAASAVAEPAPAARAPQITVHARELAPPSTFAAALEPARGEALGPFLQIARTYLVRALDDGFEIVDQHALHERIQFEALREAVGRGAVEVQRLLVPELVELSRAQAELAAEHREAFARLGLELERFGATTVAVHGLPARLKRPDVEGLVRDVLELIEARGRAPDSAELLEEVLHRAACRSSVMAGDELSEAEIRELFARGRGLASDQTCPHARPTRVRFTLADLEKAFHRR